MSWLRYWKQASNHIGSVLYSFLTFFFVWELHTDPIPQNRLTVDTNLLNGTKADPIPLSRLKAEPNPLNRLKVEPIILTWLIVESNPLS